MPTVDLGHGVTALEAEDEALTDAEAETEADEEADEDADEWAEAETPSGDNADALADADARSSKRWPNAGPTRWRRRTPTKLAQRGRRGRG